MREISILLTALLIIVGTSRAQLLLEPQSPRIEVMYGDIAVGMSGIDVGISGAPVEDWALAFYSKWYPGPQGPFYQMNSDFIGGVKAKYYGIMSEGYFIGPQLGLQIESGYRPFIGGVWGYDFFTRTKKNRPFNDLHAGFELQAGIDIKGDGYIGLGFTIGFGWQYETFY